MSFLNLYGTRFLTWISIWIQLLRSPDIGLMALPESEIRELAVSLGLSGISPGQSKSQLVELITQQQQRAEASNSRRQAMPRRSLLQTSVRAASLSAQRPGGRETERNESRRNNLNSQSLGSERSERGSRSSHPTGSVPPSSRVRMQPMQPQPPALETRQSAHGRPPRGKGSNSNAKAKWPSNGHKPKIEFGITEFTVSTNFGHFCWPPTGPSCLQQKTTSNTAKHRTATTRGIKCLPF